MARTVRTPTARLLPASKTLKVNQSGPSLFVILSQLIELISLKVLLCVSDSSSIPSPQPHTFQINFNSLYTALCEQQKSDQVTLLLYTLLHQNSNMRTYILSRTDMENLVRSRAFSTCAHAFHSANRMHAFIQMQLQTPDCCQSFIVGRTS